MNWKHACTPDAKKNKDGTIRGWKDMDSAERNSTSVFSLKQDARLLQNNIVERGADFLKIIAKKTRSEHQ